MSWQHSCVGAPARPPVSAKGRSGAACPPRAQPPAPHPTATIHTHNPPRPSLCCPLQAVLGVMPAHLHSLPNAKNFLRTFWWEAKKAELVCDAEMHIYTLAA